MSHQAKYVEYPSGITGYGHMLVSCSGNLCADLKTIPAARIPRRIPLAAVQIPPVADDFFAMQANFPPLYRIPLHSGTVSQLHGQGPASGSRRAANTAKTD